MKFSHLCSFPEAKTPNKDPNSKQDKCSLELLVSAVQETPYVFQATVIAFGCSLLIEVEGKSILLKIPCTSETGTRTPQLKLTSKPLLSGLVS